MTTTLERPKTTTEPIPTYAGGHPIWGTGRMFAADPITLLLQAMRDYPEIVRMRFGPFLLHVVSNADLASEVMVTRNRNFERPHNIRTILDAVSGVNLFNSNGEVWRRQRRLLQPAFHMRRIVGFADTMTEETERLLRMGAQSSHRRRSACGCGGRDGAGHPQHRGQGPIWRGHARGRAQPGDERRLCHQRRLDRSPAGQCPGRPPVDAHPHQPGLQTGPGRGFPADRPDHRRPPPGGGEHDDFLQMLLDLRYDDTGEGMNDEQLINESGAFFFAGHETTSNTLAWTWYLLAEHPGVEAKLHDELDRVLAGRTPALADLENLPYTRMIIEESMRLYPAAWATSRQAIEDDQIGPYAIPAGSMVMINISGIHRSPDYWDNPDSFEPERFSPERSADRPRHVYLPFGQGPRQCIGNQFAMMEAQLVLATIAQRYRLRTLPGYTAHAKPVFTLHVEGGLPMIVERR